MKLVCIRCRKRWRQHKMFCRACAREAGAIASGVSLLELDARRVERLKARFAGGTLAPPMPPRFTRILDGVEYEVVFDGAVR